MLPEVLSGGIDGRMEGNAPLAAGLEVGAAAGVVSGVINRGLLANGLTVTVGLGRFILACKAAGRKGVNFLVQLSTFNRCSLNGTP